MRRVAGQEDAPVAEPVRECGGEGEVVAGAHPYRQGRDSDREPDLFRELSLVEGLAQLGGKGVDPPVVATGR